MIVSMAATAVLTVFFLFMVTLHFNTRRPFLPSESLVKAVHNNIDNPQGNKNLYGV